MRVKSKLYITRRSNGVYYLGWYESGKRRWRTTKQTRKSDALQYLREFKHRTQETETIPTVSALLVRFTEVKNHTVRPSTLVLYEFTVRMFMSEKSPFQHTQQIPLPLQTASA